MGTYGTRLIVFVALSLGLLGHADRAAATRSCEIEVPFATIQKPLDGTQPTGRFSQELNDVLTYGYSIVSRCDGTTPTITHTTLYANQEEAANHFGKKFKTAMSIGLFVHGITTQHDAALLLAAGIAGNAGGPNPIFVYTWPTSTNPAEALPWAYEHQITLADGLNDYIRTLLKVANKTDSELISDCHSHGCAILLAALAATERWTTDQRLLYRIRHISLAAPNMPEWEFRTLLTKARTNLKFQMTLYCTHKDWAFAAKAAITRTDSVGSNCPTSDYGPNSEVVDVSYVLDSRLLPVSWNHSYMFENKIVQEDRKWAIGPRNTHNPLRSACAGNGATNCFVLRKP